jgi:hypothetical protein
MERCGFEPVNDANMPTVLLDSFNSDHISMHVQHWEIQLKLKNLVEGVFADSLALLKANPVDPKKIDHGHGLKFMYGLLSKISVDRAYDDSHPAFQTGKWVRVLPFDGREYCFYYIDRANDTHVATLLRAVKERLHAEGLV